MTVSWSKEACDSTLIVHSVTRALQDVLASSHAQNRKAQARLNGLTIFHTLVPPTTSIDEAVAFLSRNVQCSPSCFVLAFIYLDRVMKQQPCFSLDEMTVHRALLVSFVLAIKYLEDDGNCHNDVWARLGGLGLREFNALEREFLFRLDYRLHVRLEEYDAYLAELCSGALNEITVTSLCGARMFSPIPPCDKKEPQQCPVFKPLNSVSSENIDPRMVCTSRDALKPVPENLSTSTVESVSASLSREMDRLKSFGSTMDRLLAIEQSLANLTVSMTAKASLNSWANSDQDLSFRDHENLWMRDCSQIAY
eukprot:CAMPEP_0114556188 /NCGR_PEP_ID=MMETSP0114-20121206/9160_1 /TAXON_ID=31324 /ORGANISM="Goniomonas sp, Strain m" /LENGTH=308 /DNA_ID=CAMNT_0001741385 /DNA_START=22 /DNA_END=948 /DNA_ORIENTATION=+